MNIKWLIEVCRLPAIMLSLILLFSCAPRWEVAWRSGGEEKFPSVRGAAFIDFNRDGRDEIIYSAAFAKEKFTVINTSSFERISGFDVPEDPTAFIVEGGDIIYADWKNLYIVNSASMNGKRSAVLRTPASIKPSSPASSIKTARLSPDGPDIIVVGTNDDGDGHDARVYIFERQGLKPLMATEDFKWSADADLGDLDRDGKPEIALGTRDGRVLVLSLSEGEDKTISYKVLRVSEDFGGHIRGVAIADADGDGVNEIIFGEADGSVYAVDPKGLKVLWKSPNPDEMLGWVADVAVEDIDGKEGAEILAVMLQGEMLPAEGIGRAHVYDGRSKNLLWVSEPLGQFPKIGGIKDIDGDGAKEILLYSRTGIYLFKLKATSKNRFCK